MFSYYDDNSHYDDYEYGDNAEESATEADHNDSDGDKIVSTGDGVKPIFVNPNVTISAVASSATSTTVKIPKRFRSTLMRNFKQQQTTTTTTELPATTTTKQNSTQSENVKASKSHLSPCPEFELRCVDGLCITLDQICDKVSAL